MVIRFYNGFAQIIRQTYQVAEHSFSAEESVYIAQEEILAKIKGIAPLQARDILERVRANHLTKEEQDALNAARLIAQSDEIMMWKSHLDKQPWANESPSFAV